MTTTTLITSQAQSLVMALVLAYLDSHYTHGAVGSGQTTPSEADTTLVTETKRKAWNTHSYNAVDGTVSQQLWLSSTECNGESLREFGAFSASTGGDLQNRAVFDVISKTSDEEYFFENKVEVTIDINT